MKILVAGYGFVGKAHALAFEGKHRVSVHDPDKGFNARYSEAEAIVCAVSTPQRHDGSCEMANVYDVVEQASDVPILIKSTISLEGWRMLKETFPDKKLTFSPEFLRAEHALEDFKNQTVIYLGGGDTGFWQGLLYDTLGVQTQLEDPEVLILTKYFRNSFLATKVAFFNQIYDLGRATGVDPFSIINRVAEDERIGTSHTNITAERGFGGHCFPKDTSAIVKTAQRNNTRLSLIEESIDYNKKIRN